MNFENKVRNKLMKVQVYREYGNKNQSQTQNHVIAEILLDKMNLYYRP